nr:MAG TPA: amyloid beta A4 protein [Caudoviricetes sp.]
MISISNRCLFSRFHDFRECRSSQWWNVELKNVRI